MESHIVNLDTLNQSINVIDKIIPLFVWVLSGISLAVVAMAVYIVKQQKTIINLQKESTIALTKNNLLIEGHTKSNDKLFELIDRKIRK